MQDRTQMELERPVVDGDELVAPGVSMPLADIIKLEVERLSIGRTVLLGLGGWLVAMLGFADHCSPRAPCLPTSP